MQQPASETSEIALAPGMFAQLQDTTKGVVRTYVGPTLINQTGQETPVSYSHRERIFNECVLRDAIRKMPIAEEGDYLVLENPATGDKHPGLGEPKQECPDLRPGSKVNVPGPTQFALWPGQHATIVPGHKLRSNQYLEAIVYNEAAATENWKKATIRSAEPAKPDESTDTPQDDTDNIAAQVDRQFIAGQRIIIRGDEVSFFIPPTGIEVLSDGNEEYVREAVTLERLEYCILVDEGGNKRYERGPQVVFPEPTETFLTDNDNRKFRAFELNPIQGIHVKVIATYDTHKEGDELFITGDKHPIFFPRPELSIIKYGKQDKQFATAIPPGEGRYVMDRLTGEIVTVDGPDMLLPDPRKSVMIKRILTNNQSDLWYPGNQQAMAYNKSLAESAESEQSSGYVEHNIGSRVSRGMDRLADSTVMDEFARSTRHTAPRTITLDTKFEGVPQVCPWNGYAVMVVDKSGRRRVETGPTTILLKFDEALEILTLSTGKPKNTDNLKKTVYLRVMNNKVSDIVQNVFTSDHVPMNLKLSFTVDFEGSSENWFNIENYVKFLCDHTRSVLKGRIRKIGIKEFWADGADMIRNFILGTKGEDGKRPGMKFEQNGMHITDVEILDIEIQSREISRMLQEAEEEVVANNIRLERSERELQTLTRQEEIKRSTLQSKHETEELKLVLDESSIADRLKVTMASENAKQEEATAELITTEARECILDAEHKSELSRSKARSDMLHIVETEKARLTGKRIEEETDAIKERFGSMQGGFTEAMMAIANQETLVKVTQASSVQSMLGGTSLVDIISKVVGDGPMAEKIKEIAEHTGVTIGKM